MRQYDWNYDRWSSQTSNNNNPFDVIFRKPDIRYFLAFFLSELVWKPFSVTFSFLWLLSFGWDLKPRAQFAIFQFSFKRRIFLSSKVFINLLIVGSFYFFSRVISQKDWVWFKIEIKIIEGVNNNRFRNADLEIDDFGRCVFDTTHIFASILKLTM